MSATNGAVLIGFLLVCLALNWMADQDAVRGRINRFVLTMISKKIFAWIVVTGMFIWDRFVWQYDGFEYWEYLAFTCAVFGLDISQKWIGLKGKG